jgi:hypothetical protein
MWAVSQGRGRPEQAGRGEEEDPFATLLGCFGQEDDEEEVAAPAPDPPETWESRPSYLTRAGGGLWEAILREAQAGDLWDDRPPEGPRRPVPASMRDLPAAHARLRPGARAADVLNELGPADVDFSRFPDDDPLESVRGYQRGPGRLVVWLDRRGVVVATELRPRPAPAWLPEKVASLPEPQQRLFHELSGGGGFEAASRAYRAATGEDID